MAVNINFLGDKRLYGNLFNQSHEYTLRRYTEILTELGIKVVHSKPTINIPSLSSVYPEPTLLIIPTIILQTGTHVYSSPISKQVDTHTYLFYNLPEIPEGEKIIFRDTLIGYKIGNVYIIGFNPFPITMRIKYFDTAIDMIKKGLNISTTRPQEPQLSEEELIKINAKEFSRGLEQKMLSNTSRIVDIRRHIENYQRNILDELKEHETLIKENEMINTMRGNLSEKFVEKFQEIKSLSVIKDVKMSRDGIIVNFGKICIKHNGKNYYIGNLIATIKHSGITFKNTDNTAKSGSCQHPHILDNHPCFGTYSKEILDLLAQMELKRLVFILAQYLRTYYPGSKYGSISDWKEVSLNEN